MSHEAVDAAYGVARNGWSGCDWPMEFGPLKLNLTGLRARQALIMANATAGGESRQWREAFHWLRQVENDAHSAELAGSNARDAATRGEWGEARRYANEACRLESGYRQAAVWCHFLDVINQQIDSLPVE